MASDNAPNPTYLRYGTQPKRRAPQSPHALAMKSHTALTMIKLVHTQLRGHSSRAASSFWRAQTLFETIEQVQESATLWRWTYNHERPSMALGGIMPMQALNRRMSGQLTLAAWLHFWSPP